MIFIPTPIDGAYLIDIEPRSDERGFFARAFCKKEFEERGIPSTFVQTNISACNKLGTIRGLHWQAEPHGETKLFRCTHGEIYQVIVDMRPNSATFNKWYGARIGENDHRMLFVPVGCANGYQALTDGAEVTYLVGEFYHPESERGIRWNDPAFKIEWPINDDVVVSPKDTSWPDFDASQIL